MKYLNKITALMTLLITITAQSAPVGTGFSYQGELIENGQPVSTNKVFTFKLYNALTGGTQVGSTITLGGGAAPQTGISVESGLFNADNLDFGDVYTGDEYWIEISVKEPEPAICGPDPLIPCPVAQTLTPRQRINAVPYAVQADYLGPLGATNGNILTFQGGAWLPSDSGALSPWEDFTLGGISGIKYTAGIVAVGTDQFQASLNVDSTAGDPLRVRVAGNTKLWVQSNGGTAIGGVASNPPENGLFVQTKIISPDSGDADMKAYIYGAINSSGNIITGRSSDGFTASKTSTGRFKIDFTNTTTGFNYIAFAIKDTATPNFTTTDIFTNTFNVYMFDINGTPVDDTFSFVVYKK